MHVIHFASMAAICIPGWLSDAISTADAVITGIRIGLSAALSAVPL